MRNRWATFVALGVLAVIGAGAVVAATNGRSGEHSSSTSSLEPGGSVTGSGSRTDAAVSTTVPQAAREAVADGTSSGLGGLPTPELRAHVVKRATLELEVGRRQGRAALRDVIDAVGLVGGFVESTDQSGGRSRVTVRVPAAEFDATLDRLAELGRERGLQVQGEDVTATVTDLEARLRNLRAQEAILLDLMGKATTVADSVTVQQQLSLNQEQIEQLEGQRRALADQTTYATLTVSITPKGAPAAGTASETTLGTAWDDAVDAALAVTGGTLIVIGALLPIVVMGAAGVVVWRLARRQRRAQPPAPAAG